MIEVEGKYTTAKITTDDAEEYAIAQVKQLCDLEWMKDSMIICMPDIHPGKVAPIGFTCNQPMYSPIMPALIGNDIGCRVTTVKLEMKKKPEWKKLDTVIRENIPVGMKKRDKIHPFYDKWYEKCGEKIHAKIKLEGSSMGTLGGGNHFIEVDIDEEGSYYLTVHTGSRSIGTYVYEYWQDQADLETNGNGVGRTVPRELTYLSDPDSKYKYLEDVDACDSFSATNHYAIISDICKHMKWDYDNSEESKSKLNYITRSHNIIRKEFTLPETGQEFIMIRKGASKGWEGDNVIIPINMKDGIILGTVWDNDPMYNLSVPHGGGRILARSEVANHHTVNEFKTVMNGIYSPTISKDTLDEAPFAYRTMDQMLPLLEDIIEVKKILKPVYNYKGGSK